jgi:hypothetical protein
MFPAFAHAKINGRPATEVINDPAWLQGPFCETVGKRGAAIIAARGASSAASAANALVDHVRDLMTPGRVHSIAVKGNRVRDETPATQLYGTFDYGFALPIPHSSLWLRTAAGVSSGDRDNPVANYYFGGFGNNYVDAGAIKRYRDIGSMPGFEIDEIAARRYAKLTGEVNLPPTRFAEVGTAAFYLSHLRPAIFSSVLVTEAPDGGSHRYVDLGAQLDLNFTVALRLPMVLSVGAAGGWADGNYRKTEMLVSLKIM